MSIQSEVAVAEPSRAQEAPAPPRRPAAFRPLGDGAVAWLVAAASLSVLLPGLGINALWSRDETTYAEIVREMVRGGDWVTLHQNGVGWYVHPPLFFWLQALCGRLVPSVEWGARLVPVLFGAASVALVYRLGRAMFSRRAGLLAAACLALNLQFWVQSRMGNLDTIFLFFLTASLLFFWRAWQGERGAWWGMFASTGLACLAKGPYGPAFLLGIAGPFAFLHRRERRLRNVPWAGGGLLVLALGGTWYAVEELLHGRAFTDSALVYYFFGRISTQVEDQGGPYWLYLPVVLAGFYPWSFFLPQAVRRQWYGWRSHLRPAGALLLLWLILPFLVLSLAATKLPSYVILIYPPAALMVGDVLDHAWEADRRRLLGACAGGALLTGVCAAALHFWVVPTFPEFSSAVRVFEMMWLLLFFAGTAAVWACVRRRPLPGGPFLPLATGMAAFMLLTALLIAPMVEAARPIRPLAEMIRRRIPPGVALVTVGDGLYGLRYYVDRPVTRRSDEIGVGSLLRRPESTAMVLSRATFDELQRHERMRATLVGGHGDVLVVENRR